MCGQETISLTQLYNLLTIDNEDGEFFSSTIDFLKKDFNADFLSVIEEYLKDGGDYETLISAFSAKSGVHKYTLDFCVMLVLCQKLYADYLQQGYTKELFVETMRDLKYKLEECKSVYGVKGTFVVRWFKRFFLLERFALGRLQYEKVDFKYDYKHLKKGDTVYQCHIPSSGKLLYQDVILSLKKAYQFYQSELTDKILAVVCDSWLLYPPHAKAFSEKSNIKKFYDLFDVIDTVKHDHYPDLWRVFTIPYPTQIDLLPEKSSLCKNLKELYLSGVKAGNGFGIILFDGEKII